MLNILTHLADTRSRKNKEEILKTLSSLDEGLFLKVVKYALDPQYDYYIKEFDMPESHTGELPNVGSAFAVLHELNERVVTGDNARNLLYNTLKRLSAEDAQVLARIIKRDLRCGVSGKTINKVWPDHIYIHPYMRASAFSQKNLTNIEYPCLSQTKMDGLYCDIIVNDDIVTFMTRNGSVLKLSKWGDDIVDVVIDSVLQGELLTKDENGQIMERSLSNGHINSDEVDEDRLVFYCWDCVDIDDFRRGKSSASYRHTRLECVESLEGQFGDWFRAVDTRLCNNSDEVLEHFKENRAQGEEGTIVKNLDLPWKNGTSKEQVKIKVEFTCDLRVTGYKAGKGKFGGMVGAIECESSDGLLSVYAGGFTDEVRQWVTANIDNLVKTGAIVEIKSNDIITNQDDEYKYSLFLPRVVEFRKDKDEADSLDRVREQLNAYTDALKLSE
jgi:DNA ligase-1